jgi:hypothetical protein
VADGVGGGRILVLEVGGDGGADDDGAGIGEACSEDRLVDPGETAVFDGEVCACVEVAEEIKILEDRLNPMN